MIDINIDTLLSRLTDIERRRLPQANVSALNSAAFDVRTEWARRMPEIFDRPTQLTVRAPLYKKATIENPVAEVFIRNTAEGGTAPSQYLIHQVTGGARQMKPSERALGHFYVPAKGAPLDRYGNINFNTLRAILAQAGGRGPGLQGRRRPGKRNRGKRYFAVHQRQGRLKAGIYERVGQGIRPILYFVDAAPHYAKRFDAEGLARGIFKDRYAVRLKQELLRLVRV